MLRRTAIGALASSLLPAAPQQGSMMWNWMIGQLDEADGRRRAALQQVRTPAQLDALGQRVRRQMLQAIGAFPERTPLKARITGTLQRGAYAIENIIFESRPGFLVTANLYRPKTITSPRPAVIESCGHYPEGKAAPDYQKVCAGLAGKGFVAMVFDPVGQGERYMYRQYGESSTSATHEHVIAGRPAYLTGRTLAHYRIWDAMRALDYLESRPDVDARRLGMIGHSGGGMTTLLTAPLEPRLKAVMSCCAVTTFLHKTKAYLSADPEQIVPGVYANCIDHPELIAAVAPRAFLIGITLDDYVPQEGSRRTYAEVKPLFAAAGVPENVGLVETPGPHLLNHGLREACYQWMQRHLAGDPGDAKESELAVETVEALRCTPEGSVMKLPGARGLFELNRDHARMLAAGRQTNALAGSLALPSTISREPGIELPFRDHGSGKDLIVLIGPRRNTALAEALVRPRTTVREVDLRGWGETTPDGQGRNARFNWEEFFAYRAIELGRPLPGLRVLDLLAALQEWRAQYSSFHLVGSAEGGVVALHAAALAKQLHSVVTIGSLASYQSVLEKPVASESVASFVPGALQHYDLPDLVKQIAPRNYAALDNADAPRILNVCRLV